MNKKICMLVVVLLFGVSCFSSCAPEKEIIYGSEIIEDNGNFLIENIVLETFEYSSYSYPLPETTCDSSSQQKLYGDLYDHHNSYQDNCTTKKYEHNHNYCDSEANNITVKATDSADAQTTVQNVIVNEETVYITPSGKRYHNSATCGGKNSYSVLIDDVGNRTPCKKCVH